jgi:hypothetical protein
VSVSGGDEGETSNLESSGPHHTPIPADALCAPFPSHAPSVYTMYETLLWMAGAVDTIGGKGIEVQVAERLAASHHCFASNALENFLKRDPENPWTRGFTSSLQPR